MFDWGTFEKHRNWNQPETPKLELKGMADLFLNIYIYTYIYIHIYIYIDFLCADKPYL